jgi:hypothetical protein
VCLGRIVLLSPVVSGGATEPYQGGPQERKNLGWATAVLHSVATVLKIGSFFILGVGHGTPSPPLSSTPARSLSFVVESLILM